MSKYKEVYNDIKEKITNGTFKAREFLKSESDLAHKYSYSKDTIRKALSMLELDGYIQKIKGKNSMVLENGRFKNSLSNLRTSKELNKIENIDIHTNLIEMEVVSRIKEIMDVFEVSRTRVLDGEALEYEITYLDKRVVPFLDKKIVESSIYDYLEKKLHLKISHSRREIKFRYATEEEKKYMDLKNFDSVVVIESHTYLSNGTLFQYGINSYRPDKFAFSTVAKR